MRGWWLRGRRGGREATGRAEQEREEVGKARGARVGRGLRALAERAQSDR